MKEIKTTNAPGAIGPYSQAIVSGGMIYVSGQIPINPANGELVCEIKAATRQSLENMQAILQEAGSALSKVCKTTVLLKSLEDFAQVNEVYAEFFQAPYPARACFEVAKLPKDSLVEIECVAEV